MTFKPWLPQEWEKLSFSILWRGSKLNVTIGHDTCRFLLEGGSQSAETIALGDQEFTLQNGVELTVPAP